MIYNSKSYWCLIIIISMNFQNFKSASLSKLSCHNQIIFFFLQMFITICSIIKLVVINSYECSFLNKIRDCGSSFTVNCETTRYCSLSGKRSQLNRAFARIFAQLTMDTDRSRKWRKKKTRSHKMNKCKTAVHLLLFSTLVFSLPFLDPDLK